MHIRINLINCLLILFYATAPCYGQKNIDLIDYQKIKTRVIDLNQPEQNVNIPFNAIVVHDCRYDTTNIGFIKTTDNTILRLRLKDGIEKAITDYYAKLIIPSTYNPQNLTLHCYIKKLQLTDAILIDDRRVNGISRVQTEEKSGVLFKAEFYGQQDDIFIPFYRFDTTFYGNPTVWTAGHTYLEQAVVASIKRISNLNWEQVRQNGKRLSQYDVTIYNENRFQIPALQETPIKGVYRSFEDFTQNKPLNIPFVVKTKRGTTSIHLQNQKGKDSVFVEAWGYCDGRDRYIFSDRHFFKLQRNENGFFMYGTNRLKSKIISVPTIGPNLIFGGTDLYINNFRKDIINWQVYQLDMENGHIY